MTPETILDAIGEADEELLQRAEKGAILPMRKLRPILAMAASFCLVIGITAYCLSRNYIQNAEPTAEGPAAEEPTEEPVEGPMVEEPTEEPVEGPMVEEPSEQTEEPASKPEPTQEPKKEEPADTPTEPNHSPTPKQEEPIDPVEPPITPEDEEPTTDDPDIPPMGDPSGEPVEVLIPENGCIAVCVSETKSYYKAATDSIDSFLRLGCTQIYIPDTRRNELAALQASYPGITVTAIPEETFKAIWTTLS